MIRKLSTKLTLIIFLVGIVSAALVAVVQQVGRAQAILRFTAVPNQQTIVTTLSGYYALAGSWDDVAYLLQDRDPSTNPPHGPIAVVDSEGIVVYGEDAFKVGEPAADNLIDEVIPITLNNTQIGSLLIGPFPLDLGFESEPVQNFVSALTTAMLAGIGAALVVSLALATGFARSLTRPIKELTQATKAMAKGELNQEVTIRSRDEIGDLATSFNQMSHDLAKSTAARRQMTADIAHDLRTPLAVLMGYTEPLRDGNLDGSPELFAMMHDEAAYLKHLIDDLHTLSLADAGELPLSLQDVHPETVVTDAGNAYQNLAAQNGVTLRTETAVSLPPITVDPVRITQVLNNLIVNALRYTPEGGEVVVSASNSANKAQIELHVADNGAGIAAEHLPHIFDRFYRADQARSRKVGVSGSGLGLAIARSIVEAHGGRITAVSHLGEGTTFTITLPIQTRNFS